MSLVPQWLKNRVPALQNTSWVLMYHRIAEEATDPWDICVSPQQFEEQLSWLTQNANVLSLNSFYDRWRNKTLKKGSVAITFDDGYLDNYETAKPLLEKYGVPATFFIATQNMQTGDPFWWDELLHFFLFEQTLPAQLAVQIEDEELVVDIEGEETITNELALKIESWKGDQPPNTKRAAAFLQVWQGFKTLMPQAQQAALKTLKKGYKTTTGLPKIISSAQLLEVAASPLFTIGVHTVSHPALALFSKEVQQKEVIESKQILENLLQKKMEFLAYPYGNYNSSAQAVAKKAGLLAAFTTESVSADKCANPFGIGRKIITNQPLDKSYFNAAKNN